MALVVEVGEVVMVEKLVTVGPRASKVTVNVWVAWPQVESAPPQLLLPIAGLIVTPLSKVHWQLVEAAPIDSSGPPPQLPTLTQVPLMLKVVLLPEKFLKAFATC